MSNREGTYDLDYADNLVFSFKSIEHVQFALDRLARSIVLLSMCFIPSKCQTFLQDWRTAVHNLILHGEAEKLRTVQTPTGENLKQTNSKPIACQNDEHCDHTHFS